MNKPPVIEDFYDNTDPRGCNSSEYNAYIKALKIWEEQNTTSTPEETYPASSILTILNETNPYPMSSISRVEIIDDKGRAYVNCKVENVELSLQDDNRTLKIFIKNS